MSATVKQSALSAWKKIPVHNQGQYEAYVRLCAGVRDNNLARDLEWNLGEPRCVGVQFQESTKKGVFVEVLDTREYKVTINGETRTFCQDQFDEMLNLLEEMYMEAGVMEKADKRFDGAYRADTYHLTGP